MQNPSKLDALFLGYFRYFQGNPCTGTHIRSSDPKGFFLSFKTLDLVAGQSSVANSIYSLNLRKSKIYKGKSVADFFSGPPKINSGTYSAPVFFKWSVMDIH